LNGVVTFIPRPPAARNASTAGDESVRGRFDNAVFEVLTRIPSERPVNQRRFAVTNRVADDGVAVGHEGSWAREAERSGEFTLRSRRRPFPALTPAYPRPCFARENIRDERDRFPRRSFVRHGRGELGKARRLADDEPVQRQGLRRHGRVNDESGEPAQDFGEPRPGDDRHGRRWPQPFDDAMEDRAEKRRLVVEPMIEGALGDASALRDCFDARRAVAAREEEIRRRVENAIGQLRRFLLRRAAAAPADRRGHLALGRETAARLDAGGTAGIRAGANRLSAGWAGYRNTTRHRGTRTLPAAARSSRCPSGHPAGNVRCWCGTAIAVEIAVLRIARRVVRCARRIRILCRRRRVRAGRGRRRIVGVREITVRSRTIARLGHDISLRRVVAARRGTGRVVGRTLRGGRAKNRKGSVTTAAAAPTTAAASPTTGYSGL
jgi:hypothetical protein